MHNVSVALKANESLLGKPLDLNYWDIRHCEDIEQHFFWSSSLLFSLFITWTVHFDLGVALYNEFSWEDFVFWAFLDMWFREYLGWCLPKINNLAFGWNANIFFTDGIKVHLVFICEEVKYIHRLFGFLSPLLISKYQVYPIMKVIWYPFRL